MRDRRDELIEDIVRSARLLPGSDQRDFHRLIELLARAPGYAVDHALTPLQEGAATGLDSRRDLQALMREAIRFLETQQYGSA